MKKKLSVTLPDGTIATRTTARTYTHVIANQHYQTGDWFVSTWCGSLKLAQKRVNPKGRIIPINPQD